jgi:hypothetical protein
MARLAREAANSRLFGIQSDAVFSKAYAVSGWAGVESTVRHYFRYRDEREEVVRTPAYMMSDLLNGGVLEGDCDDIATFSAALLLLFGFSARLVAIKYTPGAAEFEHVFVEAWRAPAALHPGVSSRTSVFVVDPTIESGMVMQETERMVFAV